MGNDVANQNLEAFKRKYKNKELFNEGKFGTVYLYDGPEDRKWAVKEIIIKGMSSLEKKQLDGELHVLLNINYNFLLAAKEIFRSEEKLMIVSEYAEYGNPLLFLTNDKRCLLIIFECVACQLIAPNFFRSRRSCQFLKTEKEPFSR